MVGTTITRKDVMGTFVIILSVLAIVIFGGMFNGPDRKFCPSLLFSDSYVKRSNIMPFI